MSGMCQTCEERMPEDVLGRLQHDAHCGGLPSASEAYEEIVQLRSVNEKLRDIIARRLACDGSNGVWDARKNYDLTEEMRAAVSPSPVTDASDIIANALGTKPSIGEEAPLIGNMYRVDESKND